MPYTITLIRKCTRCGKEFAQQHSYFWIPSPLFEECPECQEKATTGTGKA